jgi:hypothetical protein
MSARQDGDFVGIFNNLEKALAFDPDFPEADQTRRRLVILRKTSHL